MTWTPQSHADYDNLRGLEVFTADNVHVGKICHVFHPKDETPDRQGGHFFLVETGDRRDAWGDDEVFVPERAIGSIDRGQDMVLLEVPKAQLENQAMNQPSNFERFNRT